VWRGCAACQCGVPREWQQCAYVSLQSDVQRHGLCVLSSRYCKALYPNQTCIISKQTKPNLALYQSKLNQTCIISKQTKPNLALKQGAPSTKCKRAATSAQRGTTPNTKTWNAGCAPRASMSMCTPPNRYLIYLKPIIMSLSEAYLKPI
jgi:hypothetical protein